MGLLASDANRLGVVITTFLPMPGPGQIGAAKKHDHTNIVKKEGVASPEIHLSLSSFIWNCENVYHLAPISDYDFVFLFFSYLLKKNDRSYRVQQKQATVIFYSLIDSRANVFALTLALVRSPK